MASEQRKPTQQLLAAVVRLLDYLSSYPDNELVLRACDMIYYVQSDASYHSRRHARSVAGGVHYMGNRNAPYQINGRLFCLSSVISVVVASAAEAEYAAIFMNAQAAASIVTFCMPSVTHSLRQSSFLTTLQPSDSATKPSSPNEQKLWTCGSTGFKTVLLKDSSQFSIEKESTTWQIFSQKLSQ